MAAAASTASSPTPSSADISPQFTESQKMFMQNIVRPKKPQSADERAAEAASLRQLTKHRTKNAENIINGETIAEYKEYLETRCNKLCLFKVRPDIEPYYKFNKKVQKYIDKNCKECTKTLKDFNRAVDIAIEHILPGTDPSSPSANFNMIFILIENGTAIFNALPIKFRRDLTEFGPLDAGDIEINKDSLLNQLETNVKSFIERSELARRRARAARIARHGGRKSIRRKRRKKTKRKKRKRKTKKKTKKRYKH